MSKFFEKLSEMELNCSDSSAVNIIGEIYDNEIKLIEREIFLATSMGNRYKFSDCNSLLSLRRDMINRRISAYPKDILPYLKDFNESLRKALKELYDNAHQIWKTIKNDKSFCGDMELTAKCFFRYDYPEHHPIQDEDRQKLWKAICDFEWNPIYKDGVSLFPLTFPSDENVSFESFIGMDCPSGTWHVGIDRELTKDMNIINALYNLYEHTNFAITDFIYVRRFETEINIEVKKKI